MGKIKPIIRKFLALSLSFALFAQSGAPLFASSSGMEISSEALDTSASDLSAVDNVYLRARSVNEHEEALSSSLKAVVSFFENSAEAKKILNLKTAGAKYGVLWPMYVKAADANAAGKLEYALKKFLLDYQLKPSAMPYKTFLKEYDELIAKVTSDYLLSKHCTAECRRNPSAVKNDFETSYPAKKAYAEYKASVEKEIAWRAANKAKIAAKMQEAVNKYISLFGAQLLSSEMISFLLNSDFNGKSALSEAAVRQIYVYNVTRLEKQNLQPLSLGSFSDASKRKRAKVLLSSVVESLVSGGLVSPAGDARYAAAAEKIIYDSENTAAFTYLLSAGFSSLLAKKHYAALGRILNHYTVKELKGSSWYEYINVRHYADALKNAGGSYLGKASEAGQYTTSYVYSNVFTDIARLLAEDGSPEAAKLLNQYAFNRDVNKTVKPFLAGALLNAKGEHSAKALALANMNFGDITATQEYDLDKDLLAKYPAVKSKLGAGAITTKAALEAKKAKLNRYGYLTRSADSADILLAVWGGVSLFKLGSKGVTLAKSSYTAVKASSLTGGAKIAYIKANYAKLVPYISAKRSLARLGLRIKGAFGKNINPQTFIKLQNDLNAKKLTSLASARDAAVSAAKETGKPADAAKAVFTQASYTAKKAEIDLLSSLRSEAGQSLISKYNAYKSGLPGLTPANPFTPAERGVIGSLFNYSRSVNDLNHAFAGYYPYLGFFEKGRILAFNKFSSWMSRLKSAARAYSSGPYAYTYTPYTDVTGAAGGSARLLPALARNGGYSISPLNMPYAYSGEALPVSASAGGDVPLFMPKKPRVPFVPEDATFKIVSMGLQSQVGSGYFIRQGSIELPLVFTASHVVGDAKSVQLRDTFGKYSKGRVINFNGASGYDLAAVWVEDPAFLSGRRPFRLGVHDPAPGSILMSHTYPNGDFYRTGIVEMLDNKYFHPANKFPSYVITSGNIEAGSSGGAVSLGDFDGTVIGTVMSSLDADNKVLLVPVSTMRGFFNSTVKKLLFEPALRDDLLSTMPGFSDFYLNLIKKTGAETPAVSLANPLKKVSDVRSRLLSAPVSVRDIFNSSVFRVESGSRYGTGAYINYRGFDAVITAGHVLSEDAGPAILISPSGKRGIADVFAHSALDGYDLALLVPREADFLKPYTALQLARRAPKIGMPLFSAGWQGRMFTFKDHKLLYNRFYLEHGSASSEKPKSFNHSLGYYALSGSTGPGNSGAPLISEDGALFGLSNSIVPKRDLTLAVRYSVIKDFMRQTLKIKFMDPYFDLDAFTARYPALADNYAHTMRRFADVSGPAVLQAQKAHEVKPMSEGWKNFRFWLGTKIFRLSPKSVLSGLYAKGASHRVYIPLSYTGETFNLKSLDPYRVELKSHGSYPQFPFTNVKTYLHRGMSLSESEITNIMENGLRKVDMPDQNLAILAPQVTPGTKLQAISFSPYAMVSAQYAANSLGAEKGFPVVVDVTGLGKHNTLVNVHGMFTSKDVPPERIARVSALLNIGGVERWGQLFKSPDGGFTFKPYKTDVYVPPHTNAAVFQREGANLALSGYSPAPRNVSPAEKPAKLSVSDIKQIDLVETDDGVLRSVWRASSSDGRTIGYVKYGTPEELQRGIQLDAIIKENNLLKKYDLLDIEYSRPLAADLSGLSPELQEALKSGIAGVRKLNPRFYMHDTPFIMSSVDTSGFTQAGLKADDLALLNGAPITDKEWLQVVAFYKDLNTLGFYHTDIRGNLHFRRTSSGKLKITLLDYELFGVSDMMDLEDSEKALRSLGLKEDVSTAVYPYNLHPDNIRGKSAEPANARLPEPGLPAPQTAVGLSGSKLDLSNPAQYGIKFDDIIKIHEDELEEYFEQDGYLYRAMALNLEDVLNISENGLRVKDTKLGTNLWDRKTKMMFFASNVIEPIVYTAPKLSDGGENILLLVRVKAFRPDFTNPSGSVAKKSDIPASRIESMAALIKIDGKAQWGELTVNGKTVIFKPYEPLPKKNKRGYASSSEDAGRTLPVAGSKSYTLGSEETDKYAVNFEAAMHVPSARLENNFYEAGPFYYRGMALTLEEIADIAKNGMRVRDTKPQSALSMSIAEQKDVRALFFTEDISLAVLYAQGNLPESKTKVPVVFKVNRFEGDYVVKEVRNTARSTDLPASEIVGVSAMLNIEGRPRWGSVEVKDGKILFTPYPVPLPYGKGGSSSRVISI